MRRRGEQSFLLDSSSLVYSLRCYCPTAPSGHCWHCREELLLFFPCLFSPLSHFLLSIFSLILSPLLSCWFWTLASWLRSLQPSAELSSPNHKDVRGVGSLCMADGTWGCVLQDNWCLAFCQRRRWLSVPVSAPSIENWPKSARTPSGQRATKWPTWWTPWTAATPTRAPFTEKTLWLWPSWTHTTTTTDVGLLLFGLLFFINLLYLWNSEVRGQHHTDVCYVLTPSSCLSTILVCEVFPDGVSFCSAQRPSGSYGRVRWDMGQCTVFHRLSRDHSSLPPCGWPAPHSFVRRVSYHSLVPSSVDSSCLWHLFFFRLLVWYR